MSLCIRVCGRMQGRNGQTNITTYNTTHYLYRTKAIWEDQKQKLHTNLFHNIQ